ncbi:MAG: DUF3800 domain-containing protein [Elusimicrobia bacterium]|nr:DUF3800 domain-containing protein [Elusimicrobiota bacterium]
MFSTDSRHADIKTLWRFLGLHLVLGIQKYHKGNKNNKGNTILVFDNEEREMKRFTDLIQAPPKWSSTYYGLEDETDPLSQVVDVPYFADSVDVPLLQVADFVAFFLRKHAELENGVIERYDGERLKVRSWINMALKRRIPLSAIFPKRGRCSCSEMFFNYAPSCLRDS